MGERLPGLYQDDSLTQRLTGALDEVLAPVLTTLDNQDVYLDPGLTPEDFVAWLARCVGLIDDPAWPLDRRRALVGRAAELYRQRGTSRGLAALVATFTGSEVQIEDSGGAAWSAAPGTELPGSSAAALHVRVLAKRPKEVDLDRLSTLVEAFKPAHVSHTVEVVAASR
jgi:phage tail-like protein